MALNQCNNNKLSTNTPLLFVIYGTVLLINLFISPLSIPPPRPGPSVVSILRRASQQSGRPVHVPSAAPTSAAAPLLHLRPPGTLHSSQPTEEDHANSVPSQPGRPGGRHQLERRPGPASQQLGAQQQHPPRDQVRECFFLELFLARANTGLRSKKLSVQTGCHFVMKFFK